MTDIARWSIDELQARYELEPELDDIFVEGVFDRELLVQASELAKPRRAIYEIDCVDISADVLARYGLTSGNKQRVMALAYELGSTPQNARVKCLADRDLDHWFGSLPHHPRLQWTLYCSIEAHFLVKEHIEDILVTAGRAKIASLSTLVPSLHTVLRHIYAFRLADKELSFGLKWPSLRKYLSGNSNSISLQVEGYITALLLSNKKAKQRTQFEKSYYAWVKKLNTDIRLSARGHDFTELLAWAMSEFKGQKEFTSVAAIERLFVLLARSNKTLSGELQ